MTHLIDYATGVTQQAVRKRQGTTQKASEEAFRTASDNGVGHGGEATLHLLQQVLHLRWHGGKDTSTREMNDSRHSSGTHEDGKILGALRRVVVRAHWQGCTPSGLRETWRANTS